MRLFFLKHVSLFLDTGKRIICVFNGGFARFSKGCMNAQVHAEQFQSGCVTKEAKPDLNAVLNRIF